MIYKGKVMAEVMQKEGTVELTLNISKQDVTGKVKCSVKDATSGWSYGVNGTITGTADPVANVISFMSSEMTIKYAGLVHTLIITGIGKCRDGEAIVAHLTGLADGIEKGPFPMTLQRGSA